MIFENSDYSNDDDDDEDDSDKLSSNYNWPWATPAKRKTESEKNTLKYISTVNLCKTATLKNTTHWFSRPISLNAGQK